MGCCQRFFQPKSTCAYPGGHAVQGGVWYRSRAGISVLIPSGDMGVCVLCCTLKAKAQTSTVKTKKQVRKTYTDRTREGSQENKIPPST